MNEDYAKKTCALLSEIGSNQWSIKLNCIEFHQPGYNCKARDHIHSYVPVDLFSFSKYIMQ